MYEKKIKNALQYCSAKRNKIVKKCCFLFTKEEEEDSEGLSWIFGWSDRKAESWKHENLTL